MARKRLQLNPHELAQQQIDRAMTDGVGGLEFTVQSPPGIGRLIRIPFYLQTAQGFGFDAEFGQAAAAIPAAGGTGSVTHPVILVQPPAGAGATPTVTLRTPQISWAILRVVGFECDVKLEILPAVPPMEICFQDLKIGGGATLFVHEDFAPASIYLMGQDSFAGLRDYPVLKSPNVAEVQLQAVGFPFSFSKAMSCNLVCEILQDDNYGSHIPGPYARPGALVRQGGSFVTG